VCRNEHTGARAVKLAQHCRLLEEVNRDGEDPVEEAGGEDADREQHPELVRCDRGFGFVVRLLAERLTT
jgi:hypothetical protein